MQKTRLVILSDYGLDDAVATVYLHKYRDMYDGADILAVAGNTPTEHCYQNAKILLSNVDKWEGLRLVDTSCIQQECAMLPSVHGEDGMGDLLKLKDFDYPQITYDEWLADIINAPITLVSLGPCTVTVKILEKINPANFLIMGGLTKAKPNHEGYEFNHWLDKPAFEYCAARPDAVTATLDTCRHPLFNLADKHKKGDTLIDRLINRAIDLAMARHSCNSYIYDYIAVHYLTHPESFDIVRVQAQCTELNELRVKEGAKLSI